MPLRTKYFKRTDTTRSYRLSGLVADVDDILYHFRINSLLKSLDMGSTITKEENIDAPNKENATLDLKGTMHQAYRTFQGSNVSKLTGVQPKKAPAHRRCTVQLGGDADQINSTLNRFANNGGTVQPID